MAAYYNEFDPKAAAWLRELIRSDLIAPGDVDERSIKDVTPDDLRPYTQCHFFAGIGVWSYALRNAGWPDDRPVWTGSCPCQPFSAAGKGGGFADERHLWPAFHWLIGQCRPLVVLGEQVASRDGLAWLDLVQADLEGEGYATGATDLCAAGFGAPHIRQRLWWVGKRLADSQGEHGPRQVDKSGEKPGVGGEGGTAGGRLHTGGVVNPEQSGLEGHRRDGHNGSEPGRLGQGKDGPVAQTSEAGLVGGWGPIRFAADCDPDGDGRREAGPADQSGRPGPVNGIWRASDWLFCRDGKWRPVEPGTFPLAYGAPARVGRLRGYGNAIVAQVAQAFIETLMEDETC
jgi:DNA (cytosine-5)-methyltransferase 1